MEEKQPKTENIFRYARIGKIFRAFGKRDMPCEHGRGKTKIRKETLKRGREELLKTVRTLTIREITVVYYPRELDGVNTFAAYDLLKKCTRRSARLKTRFWAKNAIRISCVYVLNSRR